LYIVYSRYGESREVGKVSEKFRSSARALRPAGSPAGLAGGLDAPLAPARSGGPRPYRVAP